MIPYGSHTLNHQDIAAVTAVLENEFLTQGQQVPRFEKALCNYTQAQFCVAVNSGTSGLHIACLALGVEKGDIVWTVPNTFAASANCALYCGATVDFVDIDPHTRNICTRALAQKLEIAKQSKALPKALIVVHFAGHMCDMEAISTLTKKYQVAIIEDAAHALGASYQSAFKGGYPQYSAMTVLSFHPVKSITSAEGGAVLTNDDFLAQRLRLFSCHGITKSPLEFTAKHAQAAHYEQQLLGFNYRLSDVHAALGLSQLQKLDEFIEARRTIAKKYQAGLEVLPIRLPILDMHSAWHLYVIETLNHERNTVFKQLQQKGIGVNIHYIPVHLHPYYQQLGFTKGQFPASETYYNNAISLPIFPSLTATDQDYVINTLHEILG